jgi:hypothetical protein
VKSPGNKSLITNLIYLYFPLVLCLQLLATTAFAQTFVIPADTFRLDSPMPERDMLTAPLGIAPTEPVGIEVEGALSRSVLEKRENKRNKKERARQASLLEPLLEAPVMILDSGFSTDGASAVILNDSYSCTYSWSKGVVIEQVRESKRILIKDLNALLEFSQFYFAKGKVKDEFGNGSMSVDAGIKIIKPDGEEINLNLDVAEQAGVVPFFVPLNTEAENISFRIALADLQVGDIIDYHRVYWDEHEARNRIYLPFSIQYVPLANSYPTVRKEISIELLDDDLTARAFSVNNEARFWYLEPEGGRAVVKMVVENLPAQEEVPFASEYLTAPFAKFQVYQAMTTPSYGNGYAVDVHEYLPYDFSIPKRLFYDDLEVFKVDLIDELLVKLNHLQKSTDKIIKAAQKKLSKIEYAAATLSDVEFGMLMYELLHDAYFESRHHQDDQVISDYDFCHLMARMFRFNSRKMESIAYVPKNYGLLSDLKFFEELRFAVRVKDEGTNDYYYYTPFEKDETRHINEIAEFTGQRFYRHSHHEDYNDHVDSGLLEVGVPADSAGVNRIESVKKVSFEPESRSVVVRSSTVYTGQTARLRAKVAVPGMTYQPRPIVKRKSEQAIVQAKSALAIERYEAFRESYYRSKWEIDFQVTSFSLLEPVFNNNHFSPEITISEELNIGGLITKVGQDYVVDVGALIGSQIEVEEHERSRQNDIILQRAHTIKNEMHVEVPEGYEVSNMELFNCGVDNTAGSFKSTARREGKVLIIETEKVYKSARLPASAWPEMIQFLDLAHEFTYKKLLLRKL